MTVYKIRRSDGLYSCGGTTPSFSKYGKTWDTIGHLKSHLTGVRDGLGSLRSPREKAAVLRQAYAGCVIIELEVVDGPGQDVLSFVGAD